MRDYATSGRPLGPMATPGVYARHNAVDTPALLPDGSTAQQSISRSLQARGNVRQAFVGDVDETLEQMGDEQKRRTTTGNPAPVRRDGPGGESS